MAARVISAADLQDRFGAAVLSKATTESLTREPLLYEPLPQEEEDNIAQQIKLQLESGCFEASGPHRAGIWSCAWSDVLENFKKSNYSLEQLQPNFISASNTLLVDQNYVRETTTQLELKLFKFLKDFLFEAYLRDFLNIYEFGCGSGYNLVQLAEKFPDKKLIGLDWSPESVCLLDLIGQKHAFNLSGKRFDFFNPHTNFKLKKDSAVLTFSALEQVGSKFHNFVAFLLENKPGLCINVEPIEEFYDHNNTRDALVLRYHRSRNYLTGFYTYLCLLESQKKLKIINKRRTYFGCKYHESYSYIIWRPV